MLIPRSIVGSIGGFDHTYFSYVEDVEWSIRCRRAGFRIVLCPKAKLWHDVSVTGKKRPAMMRYYLTRNHLWTLRRHATALQFATSMLLLPARSMLRMFRLILAADMKSMSAELRGLWDGLAGKIAPASSARNLEFLKENGSEFVTKSMSGEVEKNGGRRLRVLACAYACIQESGSPISGGEATLGWNLTRQLARFHDVWVLTATSNRQGIETELKRQPVSNMTFHYVDLPGWMQPLLGFPGGVQL